MLLLLKIFLNLSLSIHSQLLPEGTSSLNLETWNEPWQEEILAQSRYFVLGKVTKNNEEGLSISILKNFGNSNLEGTIIVDEFFMLRLKSASGHGLHLDFEEGQTGYFLLAEGDSGHYALPTPTSGFALLDEEGMVTATYRHSYHMALIPQDVYEMTYSQIWSYFKDQTYDSLRIHSFIQKYIEQDPAGFDEDELPVFFLQHAALESAYLLDIPIALDKVSKFIESVNFHAAVSALRCLANSHETATKDFLLSFIKSDEPDNFQKVIAIWSLAQSGGPEYRNKLIAIAEELSEEAVGFGGNIMDPRVATYFPSPRQAVENLRLESDK